MSTQTHAFDHGELNVPLSKRGDINAQLDKHKAQQRKKLKKWSKDCSQLMHKDRARVKQLIEEMPQEQLQRIAKRAGKTARQMMDLLISNYYISLPILEKLVVERNSAAIAKAVQP